MGITINHHLYLLHINNDCVVAKNGVWSRPTAGTCRVRPTAKHYFGISHHFDMNWTWWEMLAHVSSSVDQSGDLRMVTDGFIPMAVCGLQMGVPKAAQNRIRE